MAHQHADAISCKVIIPAGDGALWLVRYRDGHCSLPGGRAEKGEDFATSAAREVEEEIGAEVMVYELRDAWMMLDDPRREGQDCLVLLFRGEIKGQPRTAPSVDGETAVKAAVEDLQRLGVRAPYMAAIKKLQAEGLL